MQDNIQTYEELDKAEIYWINFYNSFLHGYNATQGGQKFHSYLPIQEIIEDYQKTKSARKTAINFDLDHSTVDDILNHSGIKRFSHRETMGKPIRISKDDFSKDFNSVKDCAEWFVQQGISKTKNPESVRTSLKQVRRKGTNVYLGYKIEEIIE